MLKRLLRDRKGVSLTEVVVAMTIVVMITGAAISIVFASANADAIYNDKYRALTACENAAECLRFSKGVQGDLLKALGSAGFGDDNSVTYGNQTVEIIMDEINYYIVRYNGIDVYTYKYKK